MTFNEIVEHLQLQAHPEGGFYKETYRSSLVISDKALPNEFGGERNICTSIYFLIDKTNFSALHKIKSDEIWHFYLGDALEVIEITEDGELISTLVGNKLNEGQVLQYTVKAGNWFGSRVAKGGNYSLVGCTVAPGFDFNDFEMAEKDSLTNAYPQHQKIISELTRI